MKDFKWRDFTGNIGCFRWNCKYAISYHELGEMMEERSEKCAIISDVNAKIENLFGRSREFWIKEFYIYDLLINCFCWRSLID